MAAAISGTVEAAAAAALYTPRPRDTKVVELGPEMTALLEELARNTHEVWAAQRIAEGWRYGPQRDDDRKEHPSLIPYDLLTETEKDYDRRTSREVLRLIVALGYDIRKGDAGDEAPHRQDI